MKGPASFRSGVRERKRVRALWQAEPLAAARLNELRDAEATRPRTLTWRVRDGRGAGCSAALIDAGRCAFGGPDFPLGLLQAIDRRAERIGVTRQALIKPRLANTLAWGR